MVTYSITTTTVNACIKDFIRHIFKPCWLSLFILFPLYAICIFFGIWDEKIKYFESHYFLIITIFIVAYIIFLILAVFLIRITLAKPFKNMQSTGIKQILKFQDNQYEITNPDSGNKTVFKREDIRKILRLEHTIVLTVNKKRLLLPSRDDIFCLLTNP